MQVNEHAGQAQQAKRLPDIDRAFENTLATPETRVERTSADHSRRPSMRPPAPRPGRYGAGF
jgi:hypothetical protein